MTSRYHGKMEFAGWFAISDRVSLNSKDSTCHYLILECEQKTTGNCHSRQFSRSFIACGNQACLTKLHCLRLLQHTTMAISIDVKKSIEWFNCTSPPVEQFMVAGLFCLATFPCLCYFVPMHSITFLLHDLLYAYAVSCY